MAKRLTEKQKEEIKISFTNGKSVEILADEFFCSKLTIIRNLKNFQFTRTGGWLVILMRLIIFFLDSFLVYS